MDGDFERWSCAGSGEWRLEIGKCASVQGILVYGYGHGFYQIRWGSRDVGILWLGDNIRWKGDYRDRDGPRCFDIRPLSCPNQHQERATGRLKSDLYHGRDPGVFVFCRTKYRKGEKRKPEADYDSNTLPLQPLLLLCLPLKFTAPRKLIQ